MELTKYQYITLTEVEVLVQKLWSELITPEYCGTLYDLITTRIDAVMLNKDVRINCLNYSITLVKAVSVKRFLLQFVFYRSCLFNSVLCTNKFCAKDGLLLWCNLGFSPFGPHTHLPI